VALNRGEHFTESEIGETVWDAPAMQLNWTENESFKAEICATWNLSDEQFFKQMIFPKPSEIENLFYSAEMRRIFSVGKLRFLDCFDKDGNFILPKGRGFFVPRVESGLITKIEFYDYGKLKRKAA
jgi:hypothetical protein